jgi:hypothetical protein
MPDWTSLSETERKDIEHRLTATLSSFGIKGATAWWNKPAQLPHWQLIIQTSWCDRESRTGALRVKEQAMARADVQGPMNSVVLKGHEEKAIRNPIPKKPMKNSLKSKPKRQPKEDFNQAAFRAVQETIRRSES